MIKFKKGLSIHRLLRVSVWQSFLCVVLVSVPILFCAFLSKFLKKLLVIERFLLLSLLGECCWPTVKCAGLVSIGRLHLYKTGFSVFISSNWIPNIWEGSLVLVVMVVISGLSQKTRVKHFTEIIMSEGQFPVQISW